MKREESYFNLIFFLSLLKLKKCSTSGCFLYIILHYVNCLKNVQKRYVLFSFQRPVLIILDRNNDLCTPLHHTWTYQALCHDVFVCSIFFLCYILSFNYFFDCKYKMDC